MLTAGRRGRWEKRRDGVKEGENGDEMKRGTENEYMGTFKLNCRSPCSRRGTKEKVRGEQEEGNVGDRLVEKLRKLGAANVSDVFMHIR